MSDSLEPSSKPRRTVLRAAGAAALGSIALPLLAKYRDPALMASEPAARVPAPPTAPKGQVVVGFSNEPTVFNPLMLGLSVDQGIWWNLFDPLWGIDPAGELFPILATEIPTEENGGLSADGLTWHIRLRKGVKWHDGRPFTAHDVKFTIELIKNPSFRASSRAGHDLVHDVLVLGEHELSWRLEKPFSPYLSMLAWTFIVPRHAFDNVPDPNEAPFNNSPIGTGPFKWGERRTGDHVTLLANTAYFRKGPYLERLVFKYIPDMTAMYTQFRVGAIDYLSLQGLPPDRYQDAKSLPDKEIHIFPLAAVQNITLNVGHPVLAEKAVRNALYLGLNKQLIIDALYHGLPTSTESYLPRENWAYNPNLPKHEYSTSQANQILEHAGWKMGSDGVRMKNGKRLEFLCSTVAGNPTQEQTEQFLIQDWAKIGVGLRTHNMPGAVIWGKFWSQSQFDSLVTYTNCTVASDPNVMQRFDSHAIPAKGGSGSNIYQFQNPKVDDLLQRAIITNNRQQRKDYYWEVQRIMRDELVMLPMFQAFLIEGTKKGLIGIHGNVNVLANTWNALNWYWAT